MRKASIQRIRPDSKPTAPLAIPSIRTRRWPRVLAAVLFLVLGASAGAAGYWWFGRPMASEPPPKSDGAALSAAELGWEVDADDDMIWIPGGSFRMGREP